MKDGIFYIQLQNNTVLRLRKEKKTFNQKKILSGTNKKRILFYGTRFANSDIRLNMNKVFIVKYDLITKKYYVQSKNENLNIEIFGFKDESSSLLTDLPHNTCVTFYAKYFELSDIEPTYYSYIICKNYILEICILMKHLRTRMQVLKVLTF